MKATGISIKGPQHILEKKPNQDALVLKKRKNVYVLAIADGFGSVKHSEIGSTYAVESVYKAYKVWSKIKGAKMDYLLRLIHLFWDMQIQPYPANECYTTCSFAIVSNNKVLLAQLGDGLVLYYDSSNQKEYRLESEKEFGNQTIGLGNASKISQWKILEIQTSKKFYLMLCTDGISDDLETGKERLFFEHIQKEVQGLSKKQRKKYLKKELRNWPVPNHLDDKTIAILWSKLC